MIKTLNENLMAQSLSDTTCDGRRRRFIKRWKMTLEFSKTVLILRWCTDVSRCLWRKTSGCQDGMNASPRVNNYVVFPVLGVNFPCPKGTSTDMGRSFSGEEQKIGECLSNRHDQDQPLIFLSSQFFRLRSPCGFE